MELEQLKTASTAAGSACAFVAVAMAALINKYDGIAGVKRWYLDVGYDKRALAKSLILKGFRGLGSQHEAAPEEEHISALISGLTEWQSIDRESTYVDAIAMVQLCSTAVACVAAGTSWLFVHYSNRRSACEYALGIFLLALVVSVGTAVPFALRWLNGIPKDSKPPVETN